MSKRTPKPGICRKHTKEIIKTTRLQTANDCDTMYTLAIYAHVHHPHIHVGIHFHPSGFQQSDQPQHLVVQTFTVAHADLQRGETFTKRRRSDEEA